MDIMTAIDAIPGIGPLLPYLALAIALCAALAAFLPAPGDNSSAVYRALYGVVNFVAVNMGHARNAAVKAIPLLIVGALSLGACTMTPDQQAKVAQITTALCRVDAVAQPVAVQLAQPVAAAVALGTVPEVQLATQLDAPVHAAVQAACAGVGGQAAGAVAGVVK